MSRDIDVQIAEKVMGIPPGTVDDAMRMRHYSTNIADAWLVVEKMREKYFFHLSTERGIREDGRELEYFRASFSFNDSYRFNTTACEENAPLAICKSALLTIINKPIE